MPQLRSKKLDHTSAMVGPYLLLGVLGRGGAATVYRAQHVEENRELALKVLDKGRLSKRGRERFEQEMEICRQLRHDNLVRTYDSGTWNEHVYYSMEVLAGRDLASVLDAHSGGCAIADVLGWGLQACAGLRAAHEAGVIHRDIKPHNLFLADDGLLKVMDFGIARRTDAPITEHGDKAVLGTPLFIAPERLLARGAPSPQTDVYSLGVTLYMLLTDGLPWEAPDIAALLTAIVSEDPPPPSSLRPSIPSALDTAVMNAMSKDLSARHADCDELAAALQQVLAGV